MSSPPAPAPAPEGEISEDLEEIAERTQEAHFVHLGGRTNRNYEVGRICLPDGFNFSSIIIVGIHGGQFLVTIPLESWSRKVSERALHPKSLSKPIQCSVLACHPGSRDEPSGEQRVWVGLLNKDLEDHIEFDFPSEAQPEYPFLSEEEEISLPFADSQVELSGERFQFYTAENGEWSEEASSDQRWSKLESGLAEMQKSLNALLSIQGASRPVDPPAAPKRALLKTTERVKKVNFGSLDGLVVDAALNAGIPPEHLAEMASVVGKGPGRLGDLPRNSVTRPETHLSETEDEESEEEASAGGDGSRPGSSLDASVAKAIVKLTKVCSHLAHYHSRKKRDPLDLLLEGGSGGGGDGDGAGLVASRKGAALKLLKKRLVENPSLIYKNIEGNMQADYLARPVRLGETGSHTTARGWLESRSRIQNFPNHVRWSWTVAGIWNCFIRGEPEQALA